MLHSDGGVQVNYDNNMGTVNSLFRITGREARLHNVDFSTTI